MLFFLILLASLMMFSPAHAGTPFGQSKYSKIERIKSDFKNTVKDGKLKIVIDLSEQRMDVKRTGHSDMTWIISSGARGYESPKGTYKPQRLFERYYSKTYDDAPMHWAVFFHGGYAIHQTGTLLGMGTPQSHGCIRLAPHRAARLFKWVQAYGRSRTSIVVQA